MTASAARSLLLLAFVCGALAASIPLTTYTCQGLFCDFIEGSLEDAVTNAQAAPGIAAAVVATQGTPAVLFKGVAGRYTYDNWTAHVTKDTLFDMASVTKVMAATTATAQLYQQGYFGLDDYVVDYLPGFGAQGKSSIRIRNLLLHNAGYPPDPNPGYASPIFPCPENTRFHPAQTFNCDRTIYDHLRFNQTLINEVGAVYVYSDLSFITLMFVLGAVVQQSYLTPQGRPLSMVQPCFDPENLVCQYHAYVQHMVFDKYDMTASGYVPQSNDQTTVFWRDYWYHHKWIQGFVSDQNAYALGGVSGHAGLFSSLDDCIKLMHQWMAAPANDPLLNATTVALFIKVANLTQSSRALGWDTNDQDFPPCGSFSRKTFLHVGFTGTQLCGDPVNGVYTVLLANGRYPDFNQDGMIYYRPIYNSLVVTVLAQPLPTNSSGGVPPNWPNNTDFARLNATSR